MKPGYYPKSIGTKEAIQEPPWNARVMIVDYMFTMFAVQICIITTTLLSLTTIRLLSKTSFVLIATMNVRLTTLRTRAATPNTRANLTSNFTRIFVGCV